MTYLCLGGFIKKRVFTVLCFSGLTLAHLTTADNFLEGLQSDGGGIFLRKILCFTKGSWKNLIIIRESLEFQLTL